MRKCGKPKKGDAVVVHRLSDTGLVIDEDGGAFRVQLDALAATNAIDFDDTKKMPCDARVYAVSYMTITKTWLTRKNDRRIKQSIHRVSLGHIGGAIHVPVNRRNGLDI